MLINEEIFIKEFKEYVLYQYDFDLSQKKESISLELFKNKDSDEDRILNHVLGYGVAKYLYKLGVKEYNITLSYTDFIKKVFYIETKRGFRNYSRYYKSRFSQTTKYIRKKEHQKKTLSIEEINKRNWHYQKKYLDYRKGKHYRYDWDWNSIHDRKMEKIIKRDFETEILDLFQLINKRTKKRCL